MLRKLMIPGVAVIVLVAGFFSVWALSPVFRERVYEAALLSDNFYIQKIGAHQLRDYPSRAAAISLVVFINSKMEVFTDDNEELAEEALKSLWRMSGQDFMPDLVVYKGGGMSWTPPNEDTWPGVLEKVNRWTAVTFLRVDGFGGSSGTITINLLDEDEAEEVDEHENEEWEEGEE